MEGIETRRRTLPTLHYLDALWHPPDLLIRLVDAMNAHQATGTRRARR